MHKVADTLILSAQDLIGHLNCRHLTALDLAVVKGEHAKPEIWKDPQLELLWERGALHEQNYLKHLQSSGLETVKIDGVDITDEAVKQTLEAMRAGKQIIAQGAFSHKGWVGRLDVLRRVETPSKLGAWSYEVLDTKLARETKGGTVLQLCLYSDLLSQAQGLSPEFMYVVVPWSNFEPKQYRTDDYAAYYRRVKLSLERMTVAARLETYPDPKEYCDICRWSIDCDKKRHEDDHPSLVAGISKLQINELKQKKIDTTTKVATIPLPIPWKPERGSVQSYIRIREQARLQTESRNSKKTVFEILPLEAGFGFNCLPEPSKGDVFLDFEGDPYSGEHGLEYLLGYYYEGKYVCQWSLNKIEEKKMFEVFVDFIMARWAKYPNLHIYHYAAYEPAALKRLMGRYATREEEIDKMLRAGLFIDLSTIVRHCIRAGIESYSLKKIEPIYKYKRVVDLKIANTALASLQACLELNDSEAITKESRDTVEGYNRDDCVSLQVLRDWLEEMRAELVSRGSQINRPAPAEGTASENITEWLEKLADLIARLTKDVPVELEKRSTEQHSRWILANILDWHRRELKAVWWEFFRLRDLSAEDLLEDKAGLSQLTFLSEAGGTSKTPIHRYKFPSQECELRGKEPLCVLGGNKLGTVESISFDDFTIDIKKRQDSKDIHPQAIFTHNVIPTNELANSLVRCGEYVAQNGMMGKGAYQAARDLLLRELPRIGSDKIRNDGEAPIKAAVRAALKFAGGVFPIQGPPGTGKTYTGATMICELAKQGKKVGITANSHKVIRHLLDGVIQAAEYMKIDIQCVQKAGEPENDRPHLCFVKSNEDLLRALSGKFQVAGATAWLWSREDAFEKVDVLFVDEAAQMSLANVLAVSQAGKTIVLLGDPQQLDQPMQGSHPDGTDVSALNHILGDDQTISPEKGLFLEETWRLHPKICAFTSELFYDNKLKSQKGLEAQVIKSKGRINGFGLRYVAVPHNGNQNSSPEEAEVVCQLIKDILENRSTWIDYNSMDHSSKEKPLTLDDILIIAPYNAQVFEIQQRLPGARVGTVDKFQGQQAPIAIYSMATSTHADAPRGMEFLYSLNRLNVATSRAKCLSILVGSPGVFETDCRTPRQMKLSNAFCRYLEMAEVIT